MRPLSVLWIVAAGCGADELPSVTFLSPAPGSSHVRAALDPASGALVAPVPVAVDVTGDVARVVVTAGDTPLGETLDGALAAGVRSLGAVTLTATALAADGATLASAAVDVTVTSPEVADCHGWLDLYQLDYSLGPENLGVDDPVTVKTPINGVRYRYNGSTDPRKSLYADCQLIRSLAEGASIMRERDIVEFVDIGVYNYRCIDQTKTPPNCTMSQHAYAKAIDIAAFVTSDDTTFEVLTDWVIDPDDNTCGAATEGVKDSFLHQVICQLKAADVWNIVLTPNYNSAHRNHFHVDLTEGADTIKRLVPGDDHGHDAIATDLARAGR